MAAVTGAVNRPSHIFISHAGADTRPARQFAEILRNNGLEVWFDKDNLQPGDHWMAQLEDAIQSASAMLVYIGRLGVQTWVDREVRLGLIRNTQSRQDFLFVPVLGEGADPATLPPFAQLQQFTDLRDRERAPQQIRQLIDVLRNRSTQAAVRSEYWNTHSPFRSLQAFRAEDAWLFFGRDHDTDELLTRMSAAPTLAVIGNSGSGKSSLIQAGLIPALRRGRFRYDGKWADSWRTVVFRPSTSPFDYLAETLPGQLSPELSPSERAEFVNYCKKNLPAEASALRNAIVALPNPPGVESGTSRVLLVADQFEELFTLCPDKDIRKAYVDSLLAAAQMDSAVPVHLVISLRADFYSNCLEYPNLSEQLGKNIYNVPLASASQLRDAIESRLALAGGRAETGLIDSLLADVGGEPGNLALLEHALSRLWDKCGGSGSTLTGDAYASIGRLKGALGKYADEVYEAIRDENDRRLVQAIFLELVQLGESAQDTRRRIPKKMLFELGPPARIDFLIAKLASDSLLTTSGQGPRSPAESFVEVSHEALIREWATLRGWLETNQDDLRLERQLLKNAEEWDALKRDPGALLRGLRLVQGLEWLDKHTEGHSLIRELIQASVAARKEEKRKELRSLQSKYAIGALLAFSALISWFIYRGSRELEADRLSYLSNGFSDTDRIKSFLVSLYALQISEKRGTIEVVENTVQRMVEPIAGSGGALNAIDARSDGKLLAAAWEDGSIALLEPGSSGAASDPAHLFRDDGSRLTASGPVSALAISAQGKWLAAAGKNAGIDLWGLPKATKSTPLPFPTGAIYSLAFSPDESQLLIASWETDIAIQDPNSAASAARTVPNTTKAYQAVFNPAQSASKDRGMAIALAKGAVAIVSPNNLAVKSIDVKDAAVTSLDFSPDGNKLAFGDTSNVPGVASKLRLVALDTLKEQKTMAEQSGVVRTLFSPKGEFIVTLNTEGSATIWDTSTGEIRMRLSNPDIFRSATFTRVGDAPHIAFGTKGGKLLIYDLDVNHLRKRAHEIWLENHSPSLTADDCQNYLHQKTCPPLKWPQ